METLRQKQSRFARLVGLLIEFAYAHGFELTFGEAWRTPEQAIANAKAGKGIANSVHIDRLAVDFNLFKDGKFLSDSASHKPLGEYWESLAPDCVWGGRFRDAKGNPRPDGNHYSIRHQGRA
jgi:hypothetical protein